MSIMYGNLSSYLGSIFQPSQYVASLQELINQGRCHFQLNLFGHTHKELITLVDGELLFLIDRIVYYLSACSFPSDTPE